MKVSDYNKYMDIQQSINLGIGRAFAELERARIEASMARLLRGEEQSQNLPDPRRGPADQVDTKALQSWLGALGRLFGERREDRPR